MKHILFRELIEFFQKEDLKCSKNLIASPDALAASDLRAGVCELLIEFSKPLREKIYANHDLYLKEEDPGSF